MFSGYKAVYVSFYICACFLTESIFIIREECAGTMAHLALFGASKKGSYINYSSVVFQLLVYRFFRASLFVYNAIFLL